MQKKGVYYFDSANFLKCLFLVSDPIATFGAICNSEATNSSTKFLGENQDC